MSVSYRGARRAATSWKFGEALIRLAGGFVVLRVEERHKGGQASIDDVQNEIMERLYVAKLQPALRATLTRLRHEAFLEIKAGYTASGAAPGKNTAWTELAALKPQTVTKQELDLREHPRRFLWLIPLPGGASRVGTSSSK